MKIEITAKNLEITPAITAHIEEKLGSLRKLVERIDLEEGGELELKIRVERTSAHHHKGEIFRASADLLLPGRHLRAEDTREDLYAAVDKVRNELRAEIGKYKEK